MVSGTRPSGFVPAWQPDRTVTGNAIHLDDLQISFQRTVRMPDNGSSNKLPPTLGRFSLYEAANYAHNLTPEMAQKGGVFFPMYAREAMWVKFVSQKPYAIQLHVGSINAISGKSFLGPRWTQPDVTAQIRQIQRNLRGATPLLQDYMIVPDQQWLDGIAVEPGKVRQFVAMPSGSERSVEFQITGAERFCGIMISVTPHMPDITSRGLFTRARDWRLRINPLGLPLFEVDASSEDTVDDLKIRIEDRFREYSRHRTNLMRQGMELDGHQTLQYYGIENNALIQLAVDLRGGMQIYVKTLSGGTITLECGDGDTIEEIKKKIHLKAGISQFQQKLMYDGQQLEDGKTLSQYKIQPGAVLTLALRLFGGTSLPNPRVEGLKTTPTAASERMEMGIAAGGKIDQVIVKDRGVHYWDWQKTLHFNVQILNSKAFRTVTGLPDPETPVDAKLYAELGYPFFEKWDEPSEVAGDFAAVRSLATLDGTEEENLPVGTRVVTIPVSRDVPFFRNPNDELLPVLRPVEVVEAELAESSNAGGQYDLAQLATQIRMRMRMRGEPRPRG